MNRSEYLKAYYQENKQKILERVKERNTVVREAIKIEEQQNKLFKKISKPIVINFNI